MANNPYVNKVVFGSATLVDLTGTTATADKILTGYGAFGADGAWMDGTATGGSGSGVVWQDSQGYVHLSDEGDIPLQTKTVAPNETAQTITPDNGYYALDKVNVGAISSTYVGSGITRRSSTDLTASGATVTVPSGYYSAQASKSVASGSAGTPTASKGSVSNHAISVTPSVTNTTGYITGGTKTGTAVTVSASELVSGTKSISANGTGIDVTNYASVDVSVPSVSPTLISKSITANGTYNASSDNADGYSSVTVNVSGGGGASNYVTGTFTGTTTGAAMDITIPYSGTGYPIAIDVCVSEGANNANGTFYNTLQRYAVASLMGNKNNTETPTYINGHSPNFFSTYCRYKSSDDTASSLGGSFDSQASTLADMDAGASRSLVIRMKSPTVMSVYIASTSYGFMANIEYTYHIMYSE